MGRNQATLNDGARVDILSVVFALAVVLITIFLSIVIIRSGTFAAQEHAWRKRVSTGRIIAREYHVVLKPWHSLLVESGYMDSVLQIPLRPGDVIRFITDDPDVPDKWPLDPPFRALDKGTLLVFIEHDENNLLNITTEWRRLRV